MKRGKVCLRDSTMQFKHACELSMYIYSCNATGQNEKNMKHLNNKYKQL